MERSLEERFWAKVNKTETCWLWTAGKDKKGYGRIRNAEGKAERAHAVSYKLFVGPVALGHEVDHKCRNKGCVRPAHLRAATRKQNMENVSGPQRNNTSGYLGVTWDKRNRKWTAQVMHNRKGYFCGQYASPELAHIAVVAKRNELFTHNSQDRNDTIHAA